MCDCDQALELISLGLDGALGEEGRRALEEHLDACPACRSLAAELGQLHAAMSAPEEEAPEGFRQAVMDRVRAEKRAVLPLRKKFPVRRYASLAAAFAVLLIGAGVLRGYLGMGRGGGNAAPATYDAASQAAPGEAAPRFGPENGAAEGTAGGVSGGELFRNDEAVSFALEEPEAALATPVPRPAAKAEADGAASPSGEAWETLAANCAAWVRENGLEGVDTAMVSLLPVTQADLDGALCDEEARRRLDLGDWLVTVGDAAGEDHVELICDGGTLEVLASLA